MYFFKIHDKWNIDSVLLLPILLTIIPLLLTGIYVNAELYENQVTFPRGSPVYYVIEDGQLSDIKLNTKENSITSKINMNDNYGSLTISIPRNVIDSRISIFDSNFEVFVNYMEVDYTEVDTGYEEFRTLIIPLYPQDRTIKIRGFDGGIDSEIINHSQNNIVTIPLDSSLSGCEYTNSCFKPNTIKINIGDTLTWQNQDLSAHTITSGNVINGLDGLFDSGLILSGSSFAYLFSSSGTYDYFCMIHPWMEGHVIVESESVSNNTEMLAKDEKADSNLLTQITLEFTESTKVGQTIVFSGYLLSDGSPIPDATVQIRDEDILDTDDLLESGTTGYDGRYSISWTVEDTESNDRDTVARLSELHPKTAGIGVLNSILNVMEAKTVEVFAEFGGSEIYQKSDTCKQNAQHIITYSSCNNNILVIDYAGDTLEEKIAESLLRKMLQRTGNSDVISSILYEDKISESVIDNFTSMIIEEFFLQISSSNDPPKWIDNVRAWYDNGYITKQDLLNFLDHILTKTN